jgi:uncharacterized protein YjbI with pentapeptide repeats
MSEQQDPTATTTTTQETRQSACPHPEAVGERWGDPISEERQAELQGYLHAWIAPNANHGEHEGPFARVTLTGADVSWLAGRKRPEEYGLVPSLPLEYVYLRDAHLEGAYLREAHLEHADLGEAHLERAYLGGAHLEHADLVKAHLGRASLREAHVERASLSEAHLEQVILSGAHLKGTYLNGANLKEASLRQAHLEGGQSQWGASGESQPERRCLRRSDRSQRGSAWFEVQGSRTRG